jgi:hypothetical protein
MIVDIAFFHYLYVVTFFRYKSNSSEDAEEEEMSESISIFLN